MEAARNFSGLSSFQPLGIFVVTWDNVLPAGSSSGDPVSTNYVLCSFFYNPYVSVYLGVFFCCCYGLLVVRSKEWWLS